MEERGKFAGIFLYRSKDTGEPSSTGVEFRTSDGRYIKMYLPYSNRQVANDKLDRLAKALQAKRKSGLPLLNELAVVIATSKVLREEPNTVFQLTCDTLKNGDLAVQKVAVAKDDEEPRQDDFDDIF